MTSKNGIIFLFFLSEFKLKSFQFFHVEAQWSSPFAKNIFEFFTPLSMLNIRVLKIEVLTLKSAIWNVIFTTIFYFILRILEHGWKYKLFFIRHLIVETL